MSLVKLGTFAYAGIGVVLCGAVVWMVITEAESGRKRVASELAARSEQAQRKETERLKQARRDEEQRQELARRDQELLEKLKKTNVNQYLVFLKTKDMALWLEEAKALRPKLYAAYVAEEQRNAEENRKRLEAQNQKANPLDYLTLDTALSKGGFDTVLLAIFTVKSTLEFPVRDIGVRCQVSGNSGTALQELGQTIYDVMPAKTTKRFEVNLGFVHSQGARATCRITDVKV